MDEEEKMVYCMYFKKEIYDSDCLEYMMTAGHVFIDEEKRADIASLGMALEDFKCDNCPVFLADRPWLTNNNTEGISK